MLIVENKSEMILEDLGKMISTYRQVEILDDLKKTTVKMDVVRIKKPDKTVVDVRVPGLNSKEILDEIREKHKRANLFILTFYGEDECSKCSFLDGISYFFSRD